ncbi:MurR/RpiR family transcriptional regulator [Fundicoccus culcitae]|uniref:MurR/RpiR family transcriptional regulator n=1 Tax=Fundicoccus culcitae TaxID=2969821 RepID=A0ABY5P2F7_9LACT|nr:MurR/RpiR family transcriptional regulator [Fundicoccus culcitae]UUX32744.1 MurR/RpiR family transcriptional regulator [Fundicoccus culcitae]
MNSSPLNLIMSYLPYLKKTEKKIANYIIQNYEAIIDMKITELSEKIEVSQSSITRFTQKLGYDGYKNFIIACAAAPRNKNTTTFDEMVTDDLSLSNILKSYEINVLKSLESNITELNYDEIDKVAKVLLEADYVVIVGAVFSGSLGYNFYLKMRTITRNVYYVDDTFETHLTGKTLTKGAVVLAISQTGTSEPCLEMINYAKSAGATVVSLTASYNNPVYNQSDYAIVPISTLQHFGAKYVSTEVMFKIILDSMYIYIDTYYEKHSLSHHPLFKATNFESEDREK